MVSYNGVYYGVQPTNYIAYDSIIGAKYLLLYICVYLYDII